VVNGVHEAAAPPGPMCKAHRKRGCQPCFNELRKEVRWGMKPEVAQREVYLEGARLR
jgi:hypothetical protein